MFATQCCELDNLFIIILALYFGDNVKAGAVDKQSGLLVDFKRINSIVQEFDHTELNKFIVNPTDDAEDESN